MNEGSSRVGCRIHASTRQLRKLRGATRRHHRETVRTYNWVDDESFIICYLVGIPRCMDLGRLWDDKRLLGMYGRKGTGNSLSTPRPLNTERAFRRTSGGLYIDRCIVKCNAARFSCSGRVHPHASRCSTAPVCQTVVGEPTKGLSPVHCTHQHIVFQHLVSLAVDPKGSQTDMKTVVNEYRLKTQTETL